MTTQTVEELKARALAGDGDAAMAMARLFDQEGRHDVAVSWLDQAAGHEHIPSMVYLAARLVSGRAAPQDPVHGAALLTRAVALGSGEAAHRLALLAATGVGRSQSWGDALDLLQQAAERGLVSAQEQLSLIGRTVSGGGAAQRWARLRKSFDLKAWAASPTVSVLSADPRIDIFRGFLPLKVCRWLIEASRTGLAPAKVNDVRAGAGREDETRTNSVRGFTMIDSSLLLLLVRARIAAAAGLPVAWQEACNVLHYEPGQKFDIHVDFIDPLSPHFADELRQLGQRLGTFLIYLNDGFEGGETDFPTLNLRFKGRAGDALFFRNANDAGAPDLRTAHAGLPPISGEKWILSQWIRDRPQPVV